ncbi:RICIN domain-containing protein, partial [Streptomyces sp. WAC06614]|uniref:RICIN domain-containing protein n=1 Tax=Streptomyces sp. WAC06614 TaxID=2487416 RepID=UPI000FB52F39
GGGGGKPSSGAQKPQPHTVSNVLLRLRPVKACADIPGLDQGERGGPVNAATCNPKPEDNQYWSLELVHPSAGPGGAALFQIRNIKSKYCMDLGGGFGNKPHGSPVVMFGCNGNTAGNQLWWLEKQDDETYWIRNNTSSGRCLDWTGPSNSNDPARLALRIHDCRKGEDIWQIVTTERNSWQITHPFG